MKPRTSRGPRDVATALAAIAGVLTALVPASADEPRRDLFHDRPPVLFRADPFARPGAVLGDAPGDEALAGLDLRSRGDRAVDRAVLISVDGLRPDALGPGTPTLLWMARQGTRAETAVTLPRSLTLPSHGSMVTGVAPDRHGLSFNSHRPHRGRTRFPSVFRVAHAAGLPVALFLGKRKLEHLAQDEDVDELTVDSYFCTRVNRRALPALADFETGLAMVHYPDPDGAGHRDGWLTDGYARSVARVDGCVAELLATLHAHGGLERTLVVLTSDHGGHDRTHGSSREEDVRIPWIAIGGPARRGAVARTVGTMDTAPTLLSALGLPTPHGVEGRVVDEALGTARFHAPAWR